MKEVHVSNKIITNLPYYHHMRAEIVLETSNQHLKVMGNYTNYHHRRSKNPKFSNNKTHKTPLIWSIQQIYSVIVSVFKPSHPKVTLSDNMNLK